MEQRMSSHDVSFDPYSADDGEEGNTYSPADYLTNEDSDPMEIVEKEDFARDQINQLHNAISDLDERSQLILKERWLTDDKPTLHELADKYGISAERIRQIEKKAMEKIRTNIN
jgi:RNA polymerase sigma-32 factor